MITLSYLIPLNANILEEEKSFSPLAGEETDKDTNTDSSRSSRWLLFTTALFFVLYEQYFVSVSGHPERIIRRDGRLPSKLFFLPGSFVGGGGVKNMCNQQFVAIYNDDHVGAICLINLAWPKLLPPRRLPARAFVSLCVCES